MLYTFLLVGMKLMLEKGGGIIGIKFCSFCGFLNYIESYEGNEKIFQLVGL